MRILTRIADLVLTFSLSQLRACQNAFLLMFQGKLERPSQDALVAKRKIS
jgi:hypothetical protein